MRIRTGLVCGLLVAISLAGCGGSGEGDGGVASVDGDGKATPSAQSAADAKSSGLQYANCMRQNGISTFPDPTVGDNGQVSFDVPDNIPDSELNKAEKKCQQFRGGRPAGGGTDGQQAERQRKLAQCMRDNGFPGWPDPEADGSMRVDFEKLGLSGPDDPKLKAAEEKCRQFQPATPAGGNG
ncbi:hypothetical protein I0C86_21525 [Plantactinospora sp. S1510]|uniref:Lipoprotein n=1 Tax=Plantactinospora alkalitolerans TaxID=2789879 RepID=A0ABS0GZ97_9ACTN|nr:hypothetical protein [Plantactinospora alkalitolerans]MBF9131522.1 hypothetical protein [Plantactinospora alkalitolerans]